MTRANDALGLDVAYDCERFSIDNENAVAATDIEELLVGIRRAPDREQTEYRFLQALQEFAVFGEHLHAVLRQNPTSST